MILKRIITYIQCKRMNIKYKKGMMIHPFFKFIGEKNIFLDENVEIHRGVLFDCAESGKIVCGSGTNINSYTRIESMNEVILGENVLIAPNVYISDRNHEYRDVRLPIKKQGYYTKGKVYIEDGVWIGIHAAIIGNVNVGKNSVIGANTVVTKDVPEFVVVAGNPARIIKRYNAEYGKWINV